MFKELPPQPAKLIERPATGCCRSGGCTDAQAISTPVSEIGELAPPSRRAAAPSRHDFEPHRPAPRLRRSPKKDNKRIFPAEMRCIARKEAIWATTPKSTHGNVAWPSPVFGVPSVQPTGGLLEALLASGIASNAACRSNAAWRGPGESHSRCINGPMMVGSL
jgi:hypothetical protein